MKDITRNAKWKMDDENPPSPLSNKELIVLKRISNFLRHNTLLSCRQMLQKHKCTGLKLRDKLEKILERFYGRVGK